MGLLLGATAFAQRPKPVRQAMPKNDAMNQSVLTTVKSRIDAETQTMNFAPVVAKPVTKVVTNHYSKGIMDWDEASIMTTRYDLQSNSAVGNRIAVWPDGSAAYTATWSSDDAYATRGTGYNYADPDFNFGDAPTARVEDIKSGWPSICAYGDGELLASHADGVNIWYRATKGTGSWTKLSNIKDYTWPRIAATENGSVFVICAYQDAQNTLLNYIRMYKSTDSGNSWTEVPFFTELDAEYNHLIGADDYVMAVNGNRIAVMFNSMTYDIFYVISEDGGETWEKKVVAAWPYGLFDWSTTTLSPLTDSISWSDNSGSIAIANDGTVHMAWGLGKWAPAEDQSTPGAYSYWPYTVGIIYWNSNYENEKGGNTILPFGEYSADAEHPEWWNNGEGGVSNTMSYERMLCMAWGKDYETTGEIELNPNLSIFGWSSEVDPGKPGDWTELWESGHWGTYRSIGISTQPVVVVNDDNDVTIMYSSLSDARTNGQFYYRSAWINGCYDGEWHELNSEMNLSMEFEHMADEVYPVFGYPNAVNDIAYFGYSADDLQGLMLDEDQQQCSDNNIWAVRVNASNPFSVSEQMEAVYSIYPNPATDHVVVSSAMNTEATVMFTNLAGQTVKTLNRNLTVGENTINIDLESGVYFCTVNANGFNKTVKVVVK